MQAPRNFSRTIKRKKYDVRKATLIADNVYWDGSNMERNGTNTFLYKTKSGAYFTVFLTQWQGSKDKLEVLSENEAYNLFEGVLSEHHTSSASAFPNVAITDA